MMRVLHHPILIHEGASTNNKIIQAADKEDKFVNRKKITIWNKTSNGKITELISNPILQPKRTKNRKTLKGKTVVIDAGHGGTDNGATGTTGTPEKEVTLKTAIHLQDKLDALGAVVVMTREEDEYISLEDRAILANNVDADSFISIHYNSVPEIPEAKGISTFYSNEQHEKLANALQTEVIQETNARNRETDTADFQVLEQNQAPAVLIELGFISNADEEQLILSDSYQQKLIDGIAEGLASFFHK